MSIDALTRRDRELYVGDLPGSTTEGQLRAHVERLGFHVDDLSITRNDRADARFAFLTLGSAAERARALAELPRHAFLGQMLAVGPRAAGARPPHAARASEPFPTAHLFVGNLPFTTSADDLERYVAAVAPVAHVGIARHSRGVAFVTLADASDADRVIAALDGVVFNGRPLRVTRARAPG